MKAKVYLKMLACLVGLLTFYSCNNDLEQDKNASVEAQQVQNGQEVSLQENAYADYLELMKSLNSSPTRSMSTAEIPAYYGGCYINDDGNLVVLLKKGEGVSVRYTKYEFVSTNRLLCWLYFTLLKITLYMCQINTLH